MKNQSRLIWPLIKVCGIQSPEEGILALSCGANTIGLLVGLTHKAEDEIDVDRAAKICRAAHEHFSRARVVLVTHLVNYKEVTKFAEFIGVDAVQIHGDMSVSDVKLLRTTLPKVELFKTVHIENNKNVTAQSVIAYAQNYEPYVDGFLTDSKSIDSDGQLRIGGTGRRHDPIIGRMLVEAFPNKPVILAGGLNGENAAQAVREIHPAGIDANSGLENPDGSKNAEKILQFASVGAVCSCKTSF
ncbi:MAG: phosphoribosylanthranilate isomerase [Bdellovibrionales bacterium]